MVLKVGHHQSARQGGWRASVLTPKGIGADAQIRQWWRQAGSDSAWVPARVEAGWTYDDDAAGPLRGQAAHTRDVA